MPQPEPPMRDGAQRIRADALPPLLRWAVWLLGAQAAGLFAVVVFLLVADLSATGPSLRGGILVTSYAAIMVIVLGGLSWALLRRRGWARGPAIVLELLLLPVGYYMATGGVPLLGIPIMAIGLATAIALLAPSTREALGAR